MASKILLRRGLLSEWISANPILSLGEPSVVTDANPQKIKIGDGVTHWADLPYFGLVPPPVASINFKVEERILTSTEIAAGQLALAHAPLDPNSIVVLVDGGSVQKPIVDWIVTGNIFSFLGLGLQTILAANDILIIQYTF